MTGKTVDYNRKGSHVICVKIIWNLIEFRLNGIFVGACGAFSNQIFINKKVYYTQAILDVPFRKVGRGYEGKKKLIFKVMFIVWRHILWIQPVWLRKRLHRSLYLSSLSASSFQFESQFNSQVDLGQKSKRNASNKSQRDREPNEFYFMSCQLLLCYFHLCEQRAEGSRLDRERDHNKFV